MLKAIIIGIDDAFHPLAVRIPGVSIERKAMAHSTVDLASKAQSQESFFCNDFYVFTVFTMYPWQLTIVIILKYFPHTSDGHGVGIFKPLAIQIMQGRRVIGHAVGLGEVHGNDEMEL